MAADASSSNAIAHKYEVFLSFRGEDTRSSFVSHLYSALCRKKVKTYIDETSLERGHEISCSLMLAIQESKVSIIIFSQNYAFSSWCLDELVHILQCKERYNQIVIPVFYGVEPTDIRKQQRSFGDAFSVHEERFKDRVEKVSKWRFALSTAADLSGWDSSAIRSEAELVDKIAEDVIRKLDGMTRPRDNLNGLVGIKKQNEKIKSLLCISINDVRILGIWGMGGIGKTTLARVVFDQLSSQFESCCILANVREKWAAGQKDALRKELFSKLLEEDNPRNVESRLCNRKVLIVLDDVNDEEQLEHLIEDFRNLFGDGSRIIVTTRDAQMLRYVGADARYEVEGLNHAEALELFLLNAFKGNLQHTTNYIKISERVLKYAKGIPLALKVLGSYLRCKEIENWDSELNELEQTPNKKIQNVLKVSYDGLHEKDQQIVHDIACFFKGAHRDYAEEFWNACGFSAKASIDNLVEKSLLTITDSNRLWMHDLVQDMIRQMVLSTKKPGKRNWLWIAQDVIFVLKNHTGTEEIQGIFLKTSDLEKAIDFDPGVFEQMYNLRFLKIDVATTSNKLYFPGELKSLPTTLRYLEWWNYRLKSLPSNFAPHNLVELKMPHNKLKQLWNGVLNLKNLKHIDLSFSHILTHIPDLSRALKLETIDLTFCSSLVQVPALNFQPFHQHTTCEEPWMFEPTRRHDKFEEPWSLDHRRKIGSLNFDSCLKLKSVPNISGNIQYLTISLTAVEELPTSIWSLGNLTLLDLSHCSIQNLPRSIRELKSLKCLRLSYSRLIKFPEEPPRNIVELDLSNTSIKRVPSSIKYVSCLEVFYLKYCASLMNLPTSICELQSLRLFDLDGCSKLERFPEILEPMGFLRTLHLRHTGIIKLPNSFGKLIGLQELLLDKCGYLEFVPNSIIHITNLTKLSLASRSLVEIPDWLCNLSSLEKLNLSRNSMKRIPSSIKDLSRLIELYLINCEDLQSLPVLPLSLGILDVSGCTLLERIFSSKTALVQGHWNEYQVTPYKEFLFCNCSNLDLFARKNIAVESQIRILRTATVSVSQAEEESCVLGEKPFVSICFPGNEIPKWFNYQSEGSSITIELPPNWNHNNFLGFALCTVVKDCGRILLPNEVKCEVYFETNHSRSRKFHYQFREETKKEPHLRCGSLNLDHVLMWYNYEDYHAYFDAAKVSFNFYYMLKILERPSCSHEIIRCGIRLLYLQDAEKFGIVDKPEPKKGNAIIDSDQSMISK